MHVRDPILLRDAIRARGLPIREFAQLVGVSPGFISHLLPPRDYPAVRPRKNSCSPQVAHGIAYVARREVGELFNVRHDPRRSGPDTGPVSTP